MHDDRSAETGRPLKEADHHALAVMEVLDASHQGCGIQER